MDRSSELRSTMDKLRTGDFKKVAEANLDMGKEGQGPPMMDPGMGGAPPMMDPGMAGGGAPMGGVAPPGMLPPDMMPPAGEMMPPPMEGGGDAAGSIAAEGLSNVALRAMDLLEDNMAGVMQSGDISPVDKADMAALALASSDAMPNIPPEEIAAAADGTI